MGGPGQHPCMALTFPKVRLLGSEHRDLTQVRFTPESTDFPTPLSPVPLPSCLEEDPAPSEGSEATDRRARPDRGPPRPSPPLVRSLPSLRPFPTILWALAVSLRKALDSRRARSWEKWRLSTRRLPEYTWLTVTSALYPAREETNKVSRGSLRSPRRLLLPPEPSAQRPASRASEAPPPSSSLPRTTSRRVVRFVRRQGGKKPIDGWRPEGSQAEARTQESVQDTDHTKARGPAWPRRSGLRVSASVHPSLRRSHSPGSLAPFIHSFIHSANGT